MVTLDDFTGEKKEEDMSTLQEAVDKKPSSHTSLYTTDERPEIIHFSENISPKVVPFTHAYNPQKKDDFIGNIKAVSRVQDFLENYSKQKKKAIILYGPTGIGKSSMLSALFDGEIVELNASDARGKSIIEEKLGNALGQQSLFGSSKAILIDDIEGISGFYDRGGASAIASLVKNSTFPIIMTCHDPYIKKLAPLRKVAELIELSALTEEELISKLRFVAEQEGIEHTFEGLQIIAKHALGDLRAALNDLQMLSVGGVLDATLLQEIDVRLKSESMQDAMKKVFKTDEYLGAFDAVDESLDDVFMWMDYNIPVEYSKKTDLARAYGVLTKADVFRGRIMRRQHWRFMVYAYFLLTAGVSSAKDSVYDKKLDYKQSTRVLKIWQMNMKFSKRKNIAQKIAQKVHASVKDVVKDFEYYTILCQDKGLSDYFELDSEEHAFLQKIVAKS
ncbi:MAG: replication factor C large subunit [Candidatus Woesearchaeota archaeon]